MKTSGIFIMLIIVLHLPFSIAGQQTATVTGTIQSPNGALQGAEIDFLNVIGEFQGNCISGPNGKFRSEDKMQIGKSIKVRVTHKDYEPAEMIYKVTRTGIAGEFLLKRKMLAISGYVKDSISELPISRAEIFFYSGSVLIQTKSTNSMGYFDFETNFTYGQKISVRVSKLGYHDKEQTVTFTSEGRNILPDILLPQIGDRGLRAYILITGTKSRKPLGNVTVRYFDKRVSKFMDTLTSSSGELSLKLFQQPGTVLDLTISRPNYETIKDKPKLSEDPLSNKFEYNMMRKRRTLFSKISLATAVSAALLNGGMYISSSLNYNSYKDFSNVNRENAFKTAKSHRTISNVAAGVVVSAMAGYIIYKINQNRREAARELQISSTQF